MLINKPLSRALSKLSQGLLCYFPQHCSKRQGPAVLASSRLKAPETGGGFRPPHSPWSPGRCSAPQKEFLKWSVLSVSPLWKDICKFCHRIQATAKQKAGKRQNLHWNGASQTILAARCPLPPLATTRALQPGGCPVPRSRDWWPVKEPWRG